MTNEAIRDLIEKNYSLSITNIEKVKSAYKITTEEGRYCLKVVKYQYPHFYFIQEVMLHLQRRGFDKIPEFLITKDGNAYIYFENSFAYVTEWINARESNYNNPVELEMVSKMLAELHLASRGFTCNGDMKPRIGWFNWINVFKTRNEEILDFKKRISQKAVKDDFDYEYLNILDEEYARGQKSILGLEKSKYKELMGKEVLSRGICHHDMANHNVLIDNENKLHIIDFDYCILDSHLHDLSSLLIRASKGGKWDKERADLIFRAYNESFPILKEEYEVIREFIRYPQTFWQLGIQRYWEQQPWSMEKFMNRLQSYRDDREARETFIEIYFKGGD